MFLASKPYNWSGQGTPGIDGARPEARSPVRWSATVPYHPVVGRFAYLGEFTRHPVAESSNSVKILPGNACCDYSVGINDSFINDSLNIDGFRVENCNIVRIHYVDEATLAGSDAGLSIVDSSGFSAGAQATNRRSDKEPANETTISKRPSFIKPTIPNLQ